MRNTMTGEVGDRSGGLARRAISAIRAYTCEERGVAAVEFALVVPIFIALFFGMTALGSYLRVASDMNAAADLMGDLATQQSRVTVDELNRFMIAAEATSTDVPPGKMGIRIDGISVDALGVPRIEWTRTRNADILRSSENEAVDGDAAVKKSTYRRGDLVEDLPNNLRRADSFIVRTYITAEWVPVVTAVPTNYGKGDRSGQAPPATDSGFDIMRSRQQKFTRYHAPRLGASVACVDC